MPTQLRSRFDVLTRFLVVSVVRVAFEIVRYLGAHRDVQVWTERRRGVRDPDNRLRSMAEGSTSF